MNKIEQRVLRNSTVWEFTFSNYFGMMSKMINYQERTNFVLRLSVLTQS